MQYIYFILAVISEIIGSGTLKATNGFTNPAPSCLCLLMYALCLFFLSKALQTIDLGVAYATWCGVGVLAVTLISVLIYKEQLTIYGVIGICLVIVGCVILNMFGIKTSN